MWVALLAPALRHGSAKPRWGSLLAAAAATAVLAALIYLAAIAIAGPLLTVRTRISRADVIIVLGGNGPPRAARAAELYRAGLAGSVLITGDGDCQSIRDLMASKGVPEAVMTLECASRTTWENALFSAPILADRHTHRAILVTSWFHTRRALGCMRAAARNVIWMSAPAERTSRVWALALDTEGTQVAKEYLKLAWYALVHGIDIAQPGRSGSTGMGELSGTRSPDAATGLPAQEAVL